MRKFLSPILNVINLILVSIAWGLSGQSAVLDKAYNEAGRGNIYQVVFMGTKPNALGIVGFSLLCLACLALLVAFLPLKARKFVAFVEGLSFVGAGVLFLIGSVPPWYDCSIVEPKLSGALIAICVLLFVAGFFSLVMSALDFTAKKESK